MANDDEPVEDDPGPQERSPGPESPAGSAPTSPSAPANGGVPGGGDRTRRLGGDEIPSGSAPAEALPGPAPAPRHESEDFGTARPLAAADASMVAEVGRPFSRAAKRRNQRRLPA
ncbi:hypothetical protein [Micromonospora sp. HM5-17]|jgi:hypothetical protein|uniref:hypothetical protein n=1 Tax=Micromonospora sp. HM5-17 TaxID=2487710 RepID=UPI000F46D146|nr:hypothetical protein [Micromonospora sp. HM5-17]ROT31868.1 hypothetical protein EF879_09415 [Micromonospora sp. HM5-17]